MTYNKYIWCNFKFHVNSLISGSQVFVCYTVCFLKEDFCWCPFITFNMAEHFILAHQQSTQCVSNCYGSLFQITINIKKLCSITEFIGTLEVNINHSSCMGPTLEIVINYFQTRPESVYLALIKIAIYLICQLLLLC